MKLSGLKKILQNIDHDADNFTARFHGFPLLHFVIVILSLAILSVLPIKLLDLYFGFLPKNVSMWHSIVSIGSWILSPISTPWFYYLLKHSSWRFSDFKDEG